MNAWDKLIKHIAPDNVPLLEGWIRRLVIGEYEPTPYLRLIGPRRSGKTLFCKALALNASMFDITSLITTPTIFNHHIEGVKVFVLDEADLSDQAVVQRLHKLVQPYLVIFKQMVPPKLIKSNTRIIECATKEYGHACPTITFHVEPIHLWAYDDYIESLKNDSSAFFARILK